MNTAGLLKCIGLVSVLGLASACGSSSSGPSGTATTEPGTGQLEVFTWWVTGGNAAAVADEESAFAAQYPKVSLIKGFQAGGGGTVAQQILAMRMANNNPPDIFQGHGGDGILRNFVRPLGVPDHAQNKLADLTALYKQEGWDKAFYPSVLKSVTDQGGIYGLPVSVHKENVLFYNTKVFADNNLTFPTTTADFFTLCATLQSKGIIPMTVGQKDAFSITMIFTNFLLAEAEAANPNGGAAWVTDYWAGNKAPDDPIVVAAVADLAKLVPFMNPDRATLGYAQAAQKLANGTAAMQMMGDWMAGLLSGPTMSGGYGLMPVTQFDIAPFPGTSDSFVVVFDVWAVPEGIAAQDRANALAYLSIAGSVDVSTKFAVHKNCVPPRSDIDPTKLGPLAQRAYAEFNKPQTIVQVQSMANGVATPGSFESNVQAALITLVNSPLAAADQAAVVSALKSNYPVLKQ
jgi:glucose/mannose transport system substrate-binding protein